MPCYRPLEAWRSKQLNPTGKRNIVFRREDALDPTFPIELPCGQCIGCKLERSRQWAIRCIHEASLHQDNCFITLTYNQENLPADGSVNVEHFQLFMKRLRHHFKGQTIRFFHCGEYGDENERPHYHAILFNVDFPDKKLYKIDNDNRTYTSETLERLWTHGFCIIGNVTFESAAYVARYITKKVTGNKADDHYKGRKPEYITMSRRPGIAADFLKKWKDDIYPHDYVIVNGKKVGVPKFYDNQLEKEVLDELKKKRKFAAYEHHENTTAKRLFTREQVQEARFKLLKRSFEND